MNLIDGVGNEVVEFFIVVICGIIALLAWWSTGHRQNRFRSAVIMERNVRNIYRIVPQIRNGQHHPAMLIISGPNNGQQETENSGALVSLQTSEAIPVSSIESVEVIDADCENSMPSQSIQDREMNSIVDAMDSNTSVLRNRRLAFFGNPPNDATSEGETVDGTTAAEPKSLDDDKQNKEDVNISSIPSESEGNTSENSEDNVDNIKIRLKFLNDDLKLVNANSQQTLGDFKRKHFKDELSDNKLVRFIYNGKVLQRETSTLQDCGLFDDCVVHCLIHNARPSNDQNSQQRNSNRMPNSGGFSHDGDDQNANQSPQTERRNQEERDWDLSHVLFTLLASLLSIAWYIHIRFSTLFGVAASLAMLGLTAIYIIAVMCVYFPEAQPLHRRNAAPANAPTEARPTTN